MNLSLFAKESDRLQQKLASLQKRLAQFEQNQKNAQAILSHIQDALFLITKEGLITECNQAAATFFALDPDEVIGLPFSDFFADTLFGFSLKEMLAGKEVQKRLLLTLTIEDKSFPIEVHTAFIPSEGLLLVVRDRSEIAKLERTIFENERLKALGEMAATLAHEIRNPLGGIEGFASLLLQDVGEKERSKVEAILEGTKLINTLVTNVLDYARPCQIHFTPCILKECIAHTLSYLSPKERKRVVIECPKERVVLADKLHFGRALINLIQNGLEASRDEVIISAKKEGMITITDRGEGIAQEHLEKIKTPFFTTKTKGMGLGLSEVDKIIKAHGFTLEIESSEKGTTMRIFLGGTL